jgi:methylenetetrahydrofolate--tRNA-(uracil-5-)-methyltransferase
MTGVEGYVESTASGCVAGINMARQILGQDPVIFEDTCVIGSMAHYVSRADAQTFQPMNANFGLLNFPLLGKKHDRKERMAKQAIDSLTQTLEKYEL